VNPRQAAAIVLFALFVCLERGVGEGTRRDEFEVLVFLARSSARARALRSNTQKHALESSLRSRRTLAEAQV